MLQQLANYQHVKKINKSTEATVGTTSIEVFGLNYTRRILIIQNHHASAKLAFNYTDAAAVGTAGSITIGPGELMSFSVGVSVEQVNMISDTASTPFTAWEA